MLTQMQKGGTPKYRALVKIILQRWKDDAGLAPIRDPEAISFLPPAEKAELIEFWTDVYALLNDSGQ